jgi:hypothetical protein
VVGSGFALERQATATRDDKSRISDCESPRPCMAVSELRRERGRESWLEPTSAREAKSGGGKRGGDFSTGRLISAFGSLRRWGCAMAWIFMFFCMLVSCGLDCSAASDRDTTKNCRSRSNGKITPRKTYACTVLATYHRFVQPG